MEEAILARHGESVFNVIDVVNGDSAVPGCLTPAGVEQARALCESLREVPIDLCIVSEFERAQQTAEIALDGRRVRRLVWPALNDPLYGAYEGKLLEEYRAWAGANPSRAVPGEDREPPVRASAPQRAQDGKRHNGVSDPVWSDDETARHAGLVFHRSCIQSQASGFERTTASVTAM